MIRIGVVWCMLIGAHGFIYDSFHFGCRPITMFCHLSCANGYEKDGSGCDICHCKGVDTHLLIGDGNHHHIQNACIPSQQNCPLNCEYYVKGGTGCEFCMCDNSHHNTNQPSSTQSTAASTSTKAATSTTASATSTSGQTGATTHDPIDCELTKQVCDERCHGEYLIDHKDCTFCVCKSDLG
ncbi:uncharacterized protein LOC125662518 [Ostrea edulis]|uniref:uncharacterized protein LOC125662518 n=1 Tax=Ostrea edulis TaxID=37623 RepID=UPI002096273F|nr:uncharacterized protein LOC125662518 [Ostrea edulis]